jgi:hypothetical protein
MQYSDIENMTNEEAVDYYSPLTNSPIPCGDLENLLDWAGLAKRSAVSGSWEGNLIDFMLSNAVPALSDGLTELFSHLNKPRSVHVESDLQPWGGKMDDLLDGLLAVGQITQLVADDVIALGGGYAHPDLDVAAVQALRDEEVLRVAEAEAQAIEDAARAEFDVKMQRYNELYNIHISPLATDSNADDAAWVAALQAMSDEFIVVE